MKSDEAIVFFPTFAPLPADAKRVEVPIHGWVFERRGLSPSRMLAFDLLSEALELDEAEKSTRIFIERAEPFMADNERGKTPTIELNGAKYTLAPSTADGHTESTFTIDAAAGTFTDRQLLDYRVESVFTLKRKFVGRVQLIGETGTSVISDIDDTIKITNVLEKRELVRNTFLREFRPVAGMAEVYRRWELGGAVFHYVSGSPWQLYQPLALFREQEKFPEGSFHLRKFRLQDRSAMQFFAAPEEYKLSTIEPILIAFPNRRFILVGDSGERDPEVYGELARRHPEQIAKIAIRNITDAKLGDVRLQAAFREVAPERLLLFRTPEELLQVSVAP
ncbi:MAG: App1 family protein [Planctomycetia bacterium]|nr:App1 family protein [Planctomycetia bacterium]